MPARKLRWRKDGLKNIPLEEAIWQYMLDHATITPEGTFVCHTTFRDKNHFKSNLQARIDGLYRYSEKEVFKNYIKHKRRILLERLKKD